MQAGSDSGVWMTESSVVAQQHKSLWKSCRLPFPRRVLVPWLANVFICDYLQPSDTFEVLKDHCKELMSMEPPTDTSELLESETEATTLTAESFWHVAVSSYATSGSVLCSVVSSEKDPMHNEGSKASVKLTAPSTVASIAILLVAIMFGFVFLMFDRKNLAR